MWDKSPINLKSRNPSFEGPPNPNIHLDSGFAYTGVLTTVIRTENADRKPVSAALLFTCWVPQATRETNSVAPLNDAVSNNTQRQSSGSQPPWQTSLSKNVYITIHDSTKIQL